MDNTLSLSELTLQESDKMTYYENEVQETELLFDASAHEESDDTAETDDSLESEHDVDSEYSLESEEILDGDDKLEVVDKIDPVARVSVDDEQEEIDEDLDEEEGELHAQQEEVDQVEDVEIGADTPEEVKVGPKRSKWFAEWLRQKEELYDYQ